jgi:integron integrase
MRLAPAAGMSDAARPPKLLDRVRLAIRTRHYSRRTEEAYVGWVRRYILFHRKRHPVEMGKAEVTGFLEHLADRRHVAASTQNQALSALLFLYKEVLGRPLPEISLSERPRRPRRLPVVLTRDEVRRVLARMSGVPHLVVSLLYGSGLRLLECLELRVKDLDFERRQIVVRRGKGQKDRITLLASGVVEGLREHLARVADIHRSDLARGHGRVVLPEALARKYPNAAAEWAWQFVFPAARICRDQRYGAPTRYHLHESAVQRAVTDAVRVAGLTKRATCHTFRHHADSRIMPTALGDDQGRGGDRALPDTSVGIIRDVQETRGVDRAGDNGLASHRSASCARAPAL